MWAYPARIVCSLGAAALLTTLSALPVSAGGLPPPTCFPGVGPCTQTATFTEDGPFPVFNSCSVDFGFGLVTEVGHNVIHINVNGAQDFWVTGTDTGVFTFNPVIITFDSNGNITSITPDSSRPAASGYGTAWFGVEVNNLNFTSTNIAAVHLMTTTGVSYNVQMTGTVTLSANGVVHTQTEAHC